MYATVKIGIERKESALLVPADAVVIEKAGPSVFLVDGNRARKTRVQTGFSDGAQVEIVKGLNGDETLILVGKRALVDGQAVTISGSK
jgi:membrane fusion protein (multidrug efflux system)